MIKTIKAWFKKVIGYIVVTVVILGTIAILVIKLLLTRQKKLENRHINNTITQGRQDDETADNIDNNVANSPFEQSRKSTLK
jgi:hypothetical protein